MKYDYSFIYKDLINKLKDEKPFHPEVSIILGSGLGNFAEKVNLVKSISTSDLPGYPKSTVQGHEGYIHFATNENRKMLLFQGRVHFYEGLSLDKTLLPVFITKSLDIPVLLCTNAAGGINTSFKPGDLMIINDFNSIGLKRYFSKLFGLANIQNKIDIINYPDKNLYDKIIKSSFEEGVHLREGSYYWTSGPSYETPAEIRMMKKLGFDAVGMSTVQEILMAIILGINVIGISCITNMAAGLQSTKLNHQEVIDTGKAVEEKFGKLVKRFLVNV